MEKIDFLGPNFGGVPGEVAPKKFREKKSRLQLNNFTQKLDFDVLWFRRRRAYKNQKEKKGNKRKKKEINLIARGGVLEDVLGLEDVLEDTF